MEGHRKFLESLNVGESKKLFEAALDLIIRKNDPNNIRLDKYRGLSHQEKIDVTKIVKFLNYAGFCLRKKNEQGVEYYLNQSDKLSQKDREFLLSILQMIDFDKTLNNYRLIVDQDRDTGRSWVERKPLLPLNEKIFHEFVSLEWKIEVVLSSIAMKRVYLFIQTYFAVADITLNRS